MQAVLDHLNNALEALKTEAINQIAANASLEQHVLDAMNGLKAMIAGIHQATGL